MLPLVWGLTLSTVTLFVLVGGPPLLRPDLGWQGMVVVFVCSVTFFAAVVLLWMNGVAPLLASRPRTAPAVEESKPPTPTHVEEQQFKEDEEAPSQPRLAPSSSAAAAAEPSQAEPEVVDGETPPVEGSAAPDDVLPANSQIQRVERMFVPLMVVSAASIAFARACGRASPPFPQRRS